MVIFLRSATRLGVTLVLFFGVLFAASAADKKEKKKIPQRGLLSSAGAVGYGDVTIPDQFEGDITGGVSLNKDECSYTVTNTSEDAGMKVSVELYEFTRDGKKRRAGSSSHRLKPGESDSRNVRVRARTAGCSLWVTRWKSDKKEEPEEEEKKEESVSETKVDKPPTEGEVVKKKPEPGPTFTFEAESEKKEKVKKQDKSLKLKRPKMKKRTLPPAQNELGNITIKGKGF